MKPAIMYIDPVSSLPRSRRRHNGFGASATSE